jgi:RHS repeat-associated protein
MLTNTNEGKAYDAAGNRLTKTAVQEASPNPVSVLSQYSYDNIYELTQAVVNGSVAEGYSYDAVSNRLASAGPTSYNYNASNELTSTSAATYAYDNNGNTTSKTDSTGTTSYTWDFENRLTQVTLPGQGGTVGFKYDPFGKRVEKVSPAGTTVYVYDGDNIIQALGGSANVLAWYTQDLDLDEPLALYSGITTSYFHADGLGSITSLTDSTGAVTASYVYDSFGKLSASTGSVTNPFQYASREFDSETGLYYYRARYYDLATGRFLSEDPSGPEQGSNLYAYVNDNPLNNVDPFGLYTIDKSCKGRCQMMGGGGPKYPNQAPKLENLENVIQQETDRQCSNLSSVTDPKLRSCIQKSCKIGTIKCNKNCGSEGGYERWLSGSRTANLCPNNWPDWTTPSFAGDAVIHEWAHGCGWHHFGGKGVPINSGLPSAETQR